MIESLCADPIGSASWDRRLGDSMLGTIRLTLAAIGVFSAADLASLPFSSVRVGPSNFIDLAVVAAVVLAIYSAGWIVTRRLIGDQSKIAAGIQRAAFAIQHMALALALFIPLSFASCLFMYLGSATSGPLMDAPLASMDAALGFDWLSAVQAANSPEIAASILKFCYHAIGPLLIGLFALLASLPKPNALYELNALLAVSAVLTGVLMVAFPAAGAYAFYTPPPETFSNFTGAGGLSHLQTLTELRSGEPFTFRAAETIGLVSFPSFHTTLGMIQVYSLRRIPWLMIPVGAVVAVMIPATIPEGGHHLVDIIAGAAVAAVSIACVRAVNAERFIAARLSSADRPRSAP
jgi:membrane-associated phospholipid phosphatase